MSGMLLAGCPLPVLTDGSLITGDVAIAVLRKRITLVGDELLEAVADWFLEDDVDLAVDGWQEQVRDRLVHCLAALDGERSDTAELRVEGRWWIFAGGMSWGDAPSDAYEDLVGLSIVGLTDRPISDDEVVAVDATTSNEGE